MVTLYLKYSNDKWLTESADSFKTLYFKKYKTRESIQGSTLRSILFQHKLAVKSNNALVIISANELYQASKKTYIENFFTASAWKYSLDNWTSEVVVDLKEAGDIPFEDIEGNKNLQEIKMTLLQKNPD